MTYRVVKKINGRSYLYEQETYREGGKVKTRSRYISPIDPAVAEQVKQTGDHLENLLAEPQNQTTEPRENQK